MVEPAVSECIEHTGYISTAGYGLTYNPETKKTISAHRLAFKQANGYLPKVVMHACDNPKCVNINHLYLGTQSDNMRDRSIRGRANTARGFRLPQTKLSHSDILEIRKLKSEGLSGREIGVIFNISRSYANAIASKYKRTRNV